MSRFTRAALTGSLSCFTLACLADTLTFVAQPDVTPGVTNYSWFSPLNWFATDVSGNLVVANRVPQANENAIITGLADGGTSGIRVLTLILTNEATITNGTFSVEDLEMQSRSSFHNSTVNVLTFADVAGTNCALSGATLNILGIASGVLRPTQPAQVATLALQDGASLLIGGRLSLTDGSRISGGDGRQSRLVVQPGGVMSSTNNVLVQGSPGNPLMIDNSGVIRSDGGTLRFEQGLGWQSSAGVGEFNAAVSNSLVLFAGPIQVPNGVLSLFTGGGTNRLAAGGTIDGMAEVGAVDATTQVFRPGNLEVSNALAGLGHLRVLGSRETPATLTWRNGTLSLPTVDVDPGAQLWLSGESGTRRALAGSTINNSGLCVVLSGDLDLDQGASINNVAGATFELLADGAFTSGPAPNGGAFNNTGLFRKQSNGTTAFGASNATEGPDFNNTGVVEIASGVLNLVGGTSSGEFRVTSGGLLWFWGSQHVIHSGSSFTGAGSVRVAQGITAASWLVTGTVGAADLEVGENGRIIGPGNGSESVIYIGTLVTRGNGTLDSGEFEVQELRLLDQSTVTNSTVDVSSSFLVEGTNCTLSSTPLALGGMCWSSFNPAATLNLRQGSTLANGGRMTLHEGSQIIGGDCGQNLLFIEPGGVLSGTNGVLLSGNPTNHLVVDNSGVVRAASGTVRFDLGVDWQCSAGIGEFEAAMSNAVVFFAGPFQVPAGGLCFFTGPGTNVLAAGGEIDGTAMAGAVDAATQVFQPGNLQLESDLSGTGSAHVLGTPTIAGALTWDNGTISLTTLSINPGGKMLASGGLGSKRGLTGCALNNSGLFSFGGGTIALNTGATIHNLAGGRLELLADATFSGAAGAGATLNNAGILVKTGGDAGTSVPAAFNNSGTLEVQSGTLNFQGAWLQVSGNTIVASGAVLAGTSLIIQGGSLSGTGTIKASVNNNGLVTPGSPLGILTLGAAADYQQSASGTLLIQLGGTTAGTGYNQLSMQGVALLGGKLVVQLADGFIPQPGQVFTILTCGSASGSFSSAELPHLPGEAWVLRNYGTNVSLALAQEVTLGESSFSGGILSLSFNTTAGLNYVIQATDALNPANWQPSASIAGDGSQKWFSDRVTNPRRFYRVLLQ